MTGQLEGKVAVVTRASRGIGAATVMALATAGASVVVAARDGAALDGVAAEVRARGGSALVVPTDVSDAGAVKRLVARAINFADGRLRPLRDPTAPEA